jgi:hypothetical protein
MTASRRVWRGEYQPEPSNPNITRFDVFGWSVHRHILPEGSKLITTATKPIQRSQAPNMTFYVRGRATVTSDTGQVLDDRVPGMFSGDRPDHPVGLFTVQAVEELEFWCINWHSNRGALPELTVIRAEDNEVALLPEETRVLVCRGALGTAAAGETLTSGGELVVRGKTYALIFGGERV